MANTATKPTQYVQAEDEDEWEYEYSTTETEAGYPSWRPHRTPELTTYQTYYLTLDLPIQEFSKAKDDVVQNTRGGYRVWFNTNFNGLDGEKSREDGELDDDAEPVVDGRGLDPALRYQQADSRESQEPEPEEIQILELHSEQPLISYGGSVFRGSWAENIGTELIFASHDPQSNLPALRHLPVGLDLLAASSARVNFNSVELKPNSADESAEIDTTPNRYSENGGVYVHIHSDKYGVRRPQANFLEDLTTMKRKRGEEDQVTITTVETPHNQLLQEDSDEEVYRNKIKRNRARQQKTKMAKDAERAREQGMPTGSHLHREGDAGAGGNGKGSNG